MPLSIRSPEVERLARELAARTGETMTEAIRRALADRLTRLGEPGAADPSLAAVIAEIQSRVRALPVLDDRTPDRILGYGEHGLPD